MSMSNKVPGADQEQHTYENDAKARRIIPVDALGNVSDAQLIKFDADDSAPTYIGINSDADATDAATDWLIFKLTYSGSNVTQIQKKKGGSLIDTELIDDMIYSVNDQNKFGESRFLIQDIAQEESEMYREIKSNSYI